MSNFLFNEEEINGLSNANEIKQKAVAIKKRFDQKRQFYHSLRNQLAIAESWDELNIMLIEFDTNFFNAWNAKWTSSIAKAPTSQNVIPYFQEGMDAFTPVQEFIENILSPQKMVMEEVQIFKSQVLLEMQNEIQSLTISVQSKVDEGIKQLLGLKSELGLQKNFGENIKSELESSTKSKKFYLWAFILILALMPVNTLIISKLTMIDAGASNAMIIQSYIGRVVGAISMLALSYFFFSQFKLHQMMELRYTHLSGFLGGGATYISTLVGTEDIEIKKEINKQLAGLFMQLDEVSSLVKKNNHPADVSIEGMIKLLEQINKVAKK
ncbi:hypothetical protein [Vibrio algarum]|uniref:Uncharacterized protein n=1 Tax=Vibrio algarum TaxID=3020714 RepID=A0ABT4YMR4_9VIBR|nr:hypothetical protein [Vibrio sp. KJ40-1]MDB1122844.1 hypothetical protein [Vibrio sp. KJ40-1]